MSKVIIEIVHAPLASCDGVRVIVDGRLVTTGEYGGEPEDNCEGRDYAWVKDALADLARALGAEVQTQFTDLGVEVADIQAGKWHEAEKKQTSEFYDALYRKESP